MNGNSKEFEYPRFTSRWFEAPDNLDSPYEKADIWRLILKTPQRSVGYYLDLLSVDEVERARSFYFSKDRNRFIITHASLRIILGRYLGKNPRDIKFFSESNGKPVLASPYDSTGLSFNLSHSCEVGLIGVTSGTLIGVDVEMIRDEPAIEPISRRFFSRQEIEFIRTSPPGQRKVAFYRCWTLREAYLKATGVGFSNPVNEFTVMFVPNAAPKLASTGESKELPSGWSLFDFAPAPQYIGGIAIQGKVRKIDQWNLDI